MPAAALDADKKLWRTLCRSAKGDGYLFNHKALAKVFRAKFLAALGALGLQHVLPKGFRRARNYGFLHPNSKRLRALLRLLVFKACVKVSAQSATASPAERPKWLCRCCGGAMVMVRRRILPVITDPPAVSLNGEGVANA